jgi:hypothetical protein
VLGFCVAAFITVPRIAHAQNEALIQEAEGRFKEGLRLQDAGDAEGARRSFAQAYGVLKRPNLLLNLAQAEQLTGHLVEAITHYKTFAADRSVTPADRETARQRTAELDAQVGHIRIDSPSGAEVSIDGQPLPGRAPLGDPLDVSPGPHSVEARLGDRKKSVSVSSDAGQTATASIDLGSPSAPVVAVPLPVKAEWWGTPVKAGPSSEKVTTILTLGVGVAAGLVVGITMQVAAGAQASSIVKLQNGGDPGGPCTGVMQMPGSQCAQLAIAENQEATDENIRTGALVGAAVCAAAAAVVWLAWPDAKRIQNGWHVVPLVAPGAAGVGFVTTL